MTALRDQGLWCPCYVRTSAIGGRAFLLAEKAASSTIPSHLATRRSGMTALRDQGLWCPCYVRTSAIGGRAFLLAERATCLSRYSPFVTRLVPHSFSDGVRSGPAFATLRRGNLTALPGPGTRTGHPRNTSSASRSNASVLSHEIQASVIDTPY